MNIEGYVEVEASLFGPDVLERGLKAYLEADPVLVYHSNPDAVLGKVTAIKGRGDRIEITATLDPPTPTAVLRDCLNKIASGTIKGLSLEGAFSRDRADVSAFSIAPLTPVPGTGFITSVRGGSP